MGHAGRLDAALDFQRLGFDPGYASSPFVATFVDVTGIFIYFSLAQSLLVCRIDGSKPAAVELREPRMPCNVSSKKRLRARSRDVHWFAHSGQTSSDSHLRIHG